VLHVCWPGGVHLDSGDGGDVGHIPGTEFPRCFPELWSGSYCAGRVYNRHRRATNACCQAVAQVMVRWESIVLELQININAISLKGMEPMWSVYPTGRTCDPKPSIFVNSSAIITWKTARKTLPRTEGGHQQYFNFFLA